VGTSSIETTITVEQMGSMGEGEWRQVILARFVLVARDPQNRFRFRVHLLISRFVLVAREPQNRFRFRVHLLISRFVLVARDPQNRFRLRVRLLISRFVLVARDPQNRFPFRVHLLTVFLCSMKIRDPRMRREYDAHQPLFRWMFSNPLLYCVRLRTARAPTLFIT
jgi:hypothetical protein